MRHGAAVDHVDALGAQRGDEAVVLAPHARDVGQLARLPEPVATGVDQRLGGLDPAVGAHAVPLVAGAPHEHRAQRAHVVVAAPVRVPVAQQRRGLAEGRLGTRREEPEDLELGRPLVAHSDIGGVPPAGAMASIRSPGGCVSSHWRPRRRRTSDSSMSRSAAHAPMMSHCRMLITVLRAEFSH